MTEDQGGKRPYRLKARAKAQEATRERIVKAAVALHEELGPGRTPISAIAERAGVTRVTFYRHFPDEASVFAACTSHWEARHPLPDRAAWGDIADPVERVRAAVLALYRYYAANAGLLGKGARDAPDTPALQVAMAPFLAEIAGMGEGLIAGFGQRPPAGLAATIRHAVEFETWALLDRQGLDTAAKVALVTRWTGCAAKGG